MLRTSCALAFMIGISACNLAPGLFPETRLQVNDDLRQKCSINGMPLDDDLIFALLIEVNAALESGATEFQILQVEIQSCTTGCVQGCERIPGCDPIAIESPCSIECAPCMAAVVDQVYR